MKQWNKKIVMFALAAMVATGALLNPVSSVVFAAEQTGEQQQPPSNDAPQGGGNEHAGHHG
ncbi:hypothetical protein [Anaeromusa acidaminophila]|uniref:hypothetical protein n=1 Tax=Anaeromusa acidaminophila TaxID=81464 RepID=UPI00037351D5|nr:hypothetical protein [Anaeromusa acidaminophila]